MSPTINWRKPVFVLLLVFCLTIPSDWTQDIPARYGSRHPGLVHSWFYPPFDADHASK